MIMSSCLLKSDILMKEKTWVISLRMKNEGTWVTIILDLRK